MDCRIVRDEQRIDQEWCKWFSRKKTFTRHEESGCCVIVNETSFACISLTTEQIHASECLIWMIHWRKEDPFLCEILMGGFEIQQHVSPSYKYSHLQIQMYSNSFFSSVTFIILSLFLGLISYVLFLSLISRSNFDILFLRPIG